MAFLSPEWALPANTLLLIVLSVLNLINSRRARRERGALADQVSAVADGVNDARRIAKESHNDLVEVAQESVRKLGERRYTDSPGEDHTYKRRSTD